MTGPSFPTPFVVGHRRYSQVGRDAHGNPVAGWSAPEAREVYGWGPPDTTEPVTSGQDRDVVEIVLLVPPGFRASHKDRIILDFDEDTWTEAAQIVEYDVIGSARPLDHNPFGWNPGGTINLKAVR